MAGHDKLGEASLLSKLSKRQVVSIWRRVKMRSPCR